MIGRLRGRLLAKQPPQLLLDVAGVGYEIEAPMSTIYALDSNRDEITLHTHLVVRDDALLLYGFATADERRLFRELIRVTGVGPKLALTILSGISVTDFIATVDADDADRLTGLPGIGKKTAARLLVEMRGRLQPDDFTTTAKTGTQATQQEGSATVEARHALVALGYKAAEAERLLKGLDKDLGSEEMIREALRRAIR
ncbi:MAG TPA: Holliday junction branch migration protein RuvA [Salinisphaeraceae bacterium]|nr:Holliday junction branch migration protein RuvA [Salinisphaeraceae bacterium]